MTEIELMKLQIEIQLKEYEAALVDAVAWYAAWKARQPRGFRAVRINNEVSRETSE